VRFIVRWPLVAFAWAVERLRRLPGADLGSRLTPLAIGLLLIASLVALVAWGIEPSPQRITLAELAAGQLPRLQSWIIVSGELAELEDRDPDTHLYRLTEPGTENAHLVVRSSVELPVGPATVSGFIEGGRLPVPEGYEWSARLAADRELAHEQPPPWLAAIPLLGVVLILAARRSAYPVFFPESPRRPDLHRTRLRVGLRRESQDAHGPAADATLEMPAYAGEPLMLRFGATDAGPIRLHSAHTGVAVGTLQWLDRGEPALRVRAPAEDLTLTFVSREERDAAHGALSDEVIARTGEGG
jgi:hypothetical protein